MKLVWRKRAERAYLSQLSYVQARNPSAALRMQEIVEHRLDLLLRHPSMGRPTRRRDVRELVISNTPYLAVYQVAGDEIVILQFFHTSQNR